MHRQASVGAGFGRARALCFKHFARKGYALYNCLGRVVVIGTLSVATITRATAAHPLTAGNPAAYEAEGSEDADTLSPHALDEIVVNGSRAPLTALQSAKIVSVITRDDIQRSAAESVNDILKLATGVDVRQRGGFGVQTDISINGGTFDQITILLNGVNISSPQTGHNAADFPVSLSDIERIEVLEGASARVFGTSAFNGAVNIVTKTADATGVRATVSGGSYGTLSADAGVTLLSGGGSDRLRSRPKFSNSISGGLTRSDGGTDNSDFIKRHAFYQGAFSTVGTHGDTTPAVSVNWQAGLTSQDYGANTFYSAKYNNQYEETRRIIVSARADIMPWGEGRLTLSPTAYWHRDIDHYQLTKGLEGASNGENYHRTDVYGGGLNIHFPWVAGKTAVGCDISRDRILSTVYGDLLPEDRYRAISGTDRVYDHKGSRTNTSFFLEHNIIIGGFTLSAGALANRNTGLDGDYRLYPGIDLSYRLNDRWKVYASWNKALRVPTYTDLYTSNAVQQGDPDLKAEKISTFKAGVRYRCSWAEATLSAFYSHGTDIIDWVYQTSESTTYQALNIGKLDNMGASVDATLNIDRLVSGAVVTRIKAGYAYIYQKHETEHTIYGSLYALEYLRHKATLQIDHRIAGRLSASWALRWQQRMNGYTPYTKIDAKLMYTAHSYELYLKADNLTGHRYYDLGAVKQPGLWIMAGASFNLQHSTP